jgi:uncharacterized protein YecT (DUF1311 family)
MEITILLFSETETLLFFDCKKAASSVEQLICANTDISELDTTLGKLYSSEKKGRPELVGSQKKWLQETRNVCTTAECVRTAYIDRIAVLKSYGDCPINDLSLQGNWKREQVGPFEEMRFDLNNGERIFLSWLHQRPEMTGTWNIDKCVIHIHDKNSSKLEFDLQVKGFEKNVLRIVDMYGWQCGRVVYKGEVTKRRAILVTGKKPPRPVPTEAVPCPR